LIFGEGISMMNRSRRWDRFSVLLGGDQHRVVW